METAVFHYTCVTLKDKSHTFKDLEEHLDLHIVVVHRTYQTS